MKKPALFITILAINLLCSRWFEHHPELQPWFNNWQYCRYDVNTETCIDEFGDQIHCSATTLTFEEIQ